MTKFTPDDYSFKPDATDPSTWTRKCFGLESFASTMSENLDGFPFLTTTISIKPFYDRAVFEPAVRKSWIELRHHIPAIAVKSSRLSAPDNRFLLTYRVPKGVGDVEEWVNETLLFDTEIQDVFEKHKELKDHRWWLPSAGRWVGQLLVSPTNDGWQLSVVFNHNSNDGRSGFGILQELLNMLVPYLQEPSRTPQDLKWGEETARLPPAACVIYRKDGFAPKPDVPNPHEIVAWSWSPVRVTPSVSRDISALVVLPTETTSKLHRLCKQHGRTVTQVVTALSILAHTEASLARATESGANQWKTISKNYEAATTYRIPFTFANYRHKFADPYKTLAHGPLSTFDGMSLNVSMDSVRQFFTVDEHSNTFLIRPDINIASTFWDGMVDATARSFQEHDFSLQGFANREHSSHNIIHDFDESILHTPQLIVSSIGDLGRLGLFEEYRPSKKNAVLTVQEAICGQRMRVPALMNLFWEYDGVLSCQWFTGGEWTTEGQLQRVVRDFEEWVSRIVH